MKKERAEVMITELKKRKSRSEVILDIDDLFILRNLYDKKMGGIGMELEPLKKKMNMSHNALLTHLKRLLQLDLILFFRSAEAYKFKLVAITTRGVEIINLFGKKLNYVELPASSFTNEKLRLGRKGSIK